MDKSVWIPNEDSEVHGDSTHLDRRVITILRKPDSNIFLIPYIARHLVLEIGISGWEWVVNRVLHRPEVFLSLNVIANLLFVSDFIRALI